MGGTLIAADIIIEDPEHEIYYKANVYSWETCLWRLKVHARFQYRDHDVINYEYEAISRTVRAAYTQTIPPELEEALKLMAELALIRAIDPTYQPDALADPDLRINIESFYAALEA